MKHGERRKAQILETGLELWRTSPANVSARQIAKMLGMTHTAVLYHWKTSDALKLAIADHAIRMRDPIVVPMLIVSKHPAISILSNTERMDYLSQV